MAKRKRPAKKVAPLGCGNSTENSSKEKRPTGRRPDSAGDWAPTFIGALMKGASVNRAARTAGVDESMPYIRRKTDLEFKTAWQEACDIGTEFLEQEAARRAFHGTLKPVFHKGSKCGYVREYSDTLMIFLLKARRPDKYREGVEDGGRVPMVLNVTVVNVDAEPKRIADVSSGQQDAGSLRETVAVPSE